MRHLLLALTLVGTLTSLHAVQDVTDLLRDAAQKAGCPKDDVRVSLRWMGQDRPVEIVVSCEKTEPQ